MEEHADDQIDHLRVAAQVIVEVDRAVRPVEAVEEHLDGGGDDLERGPVFDGLVVVLAAKVAVDVGVLAARATVVRQGQHGIPRRAPAVELLEDVVRDGRVALATTIERVSTALGLEFYIGPPRGDGGEPPALPAAAETSPALVRDFESHTRGLVKAVLDAGGDPIPEDLWSVLDERRGLAAVLVLAASAGDSPPAFTPADDDTLTVIFAEDVRAAAGSGEVVFEGAADHRITVPRSILPRWARPEGLACIRAAGDSMMPTLDDGDLLLIDRLNAEPLDGQVFVIHTDDGLVVKRMREEDDGWAMTSDNSAFPSRRAGETDRVVGRLAWSGPLRLIEAHAGDPR